MAFLRSSMSVWRDTIRKRHRKHLRDEAGSLLVELGGAEEVVAVVVASGGTAIAALI